MYYYAKNEEEASMEKKKGVVEMYNLPHEIRFCKKCVISNQRPRIKLDERGVCSAYLYVRLRWGNPFSHSSSA